MAAPSPSIVGINQNSWGGSFRRLGTTGEEVPHLFSFVHPMVGRSNEVDLPCWLPQAAIGPIPKLLGAPMAIYDHI